MKHKTCICNGHTAGYGVLRLDNTHGWAVTCTNCDAITPRFCSEQKAIAVWDAMQEEAKEDE